jgi:hypothetical protein
LRLKVGGKVFKAQLITTRQIFFILIFLCTLNACTFQANTAKLQQLRVTNNSDTDITNLVVLFPGPTWDSEASRVEFGNIPAGQTSKYQEVPSGVYRYAAYEYTLNGQGVSQFVTDWVGENPMAGKKFTYQILLDPQKIEGDQITLVTVVVDEP